MRGEAVAERHSCEFPYVALFREPAWPRSGGGQQKQTPNLQHSDTWERRNRVPLGMAVISSSFPSYTRLTKPL